MNHGDASGTVVIQIGTSKKWLIMKTDVNGKGKNGELNYL